MIIATALVYDARLASIDVVLPTPPLVTSRVGRKLSKSDNALSLSALRPAGVTADDIYRLTLRIC